MIGYKKTSIYTTVRKKIKTSYTFNNKVKTAIDYLFAFTSIGTYIGIYLTLLFFLLSVIIGIYSLYQYLMFNNIVKGWTPIMLFLSLGFSGLFAILTIVIQYLVIIMKEVRTLPNSIIKNIEKL
jgi:dolichol-phosphate mannosyltransferase